MATRRRYGYRPHFGGEGVDFSFTATASIAVLWSDIRRKGHSIGLYVNALAKIAGEYKATKVQTRLISIEME